MGMSEEEDPVRICQTEAANRLYSRFQDRVNRRTPASKSADGTPLLDLPELEITSPLFFQPPLIGPCRTVPSSRVAVISALLGSISSTVWEYRSPVPLARTCGLLSHLKLDTSQWALGSIRVARWSSTSSPGMTPPRSSSSNGRWSCLLSPHLGSEDRGYME